MRLLSIGVLLLLWPMLVMADGSMRCSFPVPDGRPIVHDLVWDEGVLVMDGHAIWDRESDKGPEPYQGSLAYPGLKVDKRTIEGRTVFIIHSISPKSSLKISFDPRWAVLDRPEYPRTRGDCHAGFDA